MLAAILEEAAAGHGPKTESRRKIGDYYASCLDEAAIEARGLKPLAPGVRPYLLTPAALNIPATAGPNSLARAQGREHDRLFRWLSRSAVDWVEPQPVFLVLLIAVASSLHRSIDRQSSKTIVCRGRSLR